MIARQVQLGQAAANGVGLSPPIQRGVHADAANLQLHKAQHPWYAVWDAAQPVWPGGTGP
jgi:hypothetical protein